MLPLVGELLLQAWEQGAGEPEVSRPLALLQQALPDFEREELLSLPVTRRDSLLLELHAATFGALLEAVGECSSCGERFEFALPAAGLIPESPASISWFEHDRPLVLRAVTTADLIDTLGAAELQEARNRLLLRCFDGDPHSSEQLSERFEELHTGAELCSTLTCPACGAQEPVELDVARFLWLEVQRAAQRLLFDVHDLAARYGWSERAILAMDARRRNAYLELNGL